ncbi:unnamed protein product [Closterium sp. NIES-53]
MRFSPNMFQPIHGEQRGGAGPMPMELDTIDKNKEKRKGALLEIASSECPTLLTPSSTPLQQESEGAIVLRGQIHGKEVKMLLDSGASSNFISSQLAHELKLPVQSGTVESSVCMVDGVVRSCGPELYPVSCNIGEFHGKISFQQIWLDSHDIILGRNWLATVSPQVDWRTREVKVLFGGRSVCLPVVQQQEEMTLQLISAKQFGKAIRGEEAVFLGLITEVQPTSPEAAIPTVSASHEDKELTWGVEKLLEKFSGVFPKDLPAGLPPKRAADHRIELIPGSTPPVRPTYKMSAVELKELKKQLEELLAKEFIQPSSSPYASPVLFVRKKDGSLRMCVDYHGLNKITMKNWYPLPRIDELFEQVGEARYFSKLDLRSGYHQVRIQMLPFGLTNAPATFQGMMQSIFSDFIDKFLVIFIDDLLVYSRTHEEHLKHLELVLARLSEHILYAKRSKCEFAETKLSFLGHVISYGKLEVDNSKVAVLKQWKQPSTVKEVQAFSGLANYYRRFVKGFAAVAAPLTDLLRKDSSFSWGPLQQQDFEQLKTCLTSPPALAVPNPELPYFIWCDASDVALGAILFQEQEAGLQPIAFESRKLTAAERAYPIHEREALAVVHALKKWRCYVEMQPVTVFTDHRTLEYLKTQSQITPRQARWVQFLEQYIPNLQIVFKPGRFNPADVLSWPAAEEPNVMGVVIWDRNFITRFSRGYNRDQMYQQKASHDPSFLFSNPIGPVQILCS